jgi:peroxiredoxin
LNRPVSGACLALTLLATAASARALEIGGTAPDFRLQTIDGRTFSLAEAEESHRAVVVMFLSTICPFSNFYNDRIREMASDFQKRGVLFVAINSGRLESAEEVRAHAREHGHTFPIIKDAEGKVAGLLGARRTPEVFLLDHDGRLRYHGRIASKTSSPDLLNALESLLTGGRIRPAETKAFGCAIQRG